MTTLAQVKTVEEEVQKMILFKDPAQNRFMTYGEVREQFINLGRKLMKQANAKFIFNKVEEDDFMQLIDLELWKAFDQYDPNYGFAFTTFLVPKLKKAVRDATYSKFSQKNQGTVVSADEEMGEEGMTICDTLEAETNIEAEYQESELFKMLKETLSPIEFDCVIHLTDKKELTAAEIAEKYGMSRQGATKRIRQTKSKLKELLSNS